MTDSPPAAQRPWLDRVCGDRPEVPYMAPMMAFLALIMVDGWVGDAYFIYSYALRSIVGLGLIILFWKHYPPLGKAHWPEAIVVGLLVAYGWVAIHHWFADQPWYPLTQRFGKDATPDEYFIPSEHFGPVGVWIFLAVRIGGASITVPLVEEIFWRAFLLRALIDWHRFDRVPIGEFTFLSFAVCSLASAFEHTQWEVGILCWVVYNLLLYWRKSLLCLILTHGITNFALYTYVYIREDWVFW